MSIQNYLIRYTIRKRINKTDMAKLPLKLHRKGMDNFGKMAKIPNGVSFEKTSCDGVPAEWAVPNNLMTRGVVLYLHGGAYAMGSIASHRSLSANIALASKTKCITIDYRLAPEHPFPCAVDDALKSYKWLLKKGFKPEKIVLAGDSAGGGLAIATLIRLKQENLPLPCTAVCLSPWLDLEGSGESSNELMKKDPMIDVPSMKVFAAHYVSDDQLRHPMASPLYADLSGLPPIYIQVSLSEVLLDDTLRFEKKAKAAGVTVEVETWQKTVHVWQLFGSMLPEAMKAIKKIGVYIENKVK
jgi:epsilon-lactone hydrolase